MSALAAGGATFLTFARRAEALVGEDAGTVTITPYGGQAIAPDGLQFVERRLLAGKLGVLVNTALRAALTSAPGAWAAAPQCFVAMYGLVAIRPVYEKLPAL